MTPGVLKLLLPVTKGIKSFALGVAYSVKYEELLPYLGELKNLQRLKIFHYTVRLAYSGLLFHD